MLVTNSNLPTACDAFRELASGAGDYEAYCFYLYMTLLHRCSAAYPVPIYDECSPDVVLRIIPTAHHEAFKVLHKAVITYLDKGAEKATPFYDLLKNKYLISMMSFKQLCDIDSVFV